MPDESISPDDPTDAVSGVGDSRKQDLEDAGYTTVKDLQNASVDGLSTAVPLRVANEIKDQVGDQVAHLTSISEAKTKARQIPGAKAKTVRGPDGRQRAKVLRKEVERDVGGATLQVHKG